MQGLAKNSIEVRLSAYLASLLVHVEYGLFREVVVFVIGIKAFFVNIELDELSFLKMEVAGNDYLPTDFRIK